jgi:hypothetical protein
MSRMTNRYLRNKAGGCTAQHNGEVFVEVLHGLMELELLNAYAV